MTQVDAHLEFLKAVRDDKDVLGFILQHDIGYGWAVQEGFVQKHPAYFEFTLTARGRQHLAEMEAASPDSTERRKELKGKG